MLWGGNAGFRRSHATTTSWWNGLGNPEECPQEWVHGSLKGYATVLAHSFLRLPNKAVPTRTQVAPSSMAVSRSFDIPMESSVNPCASANSRRLRKYARGASGSSDHGGIVISPVSYTHLRAHETRHDLVCRLLLEKKKKKQ